MKSFFYCCFFKNRTMKNFAHFQEHKLRISYKKCFNLSKTQKVVKFKFKFENVLLMPGFQVAKFFAQSKGKIHLQLCERNKANYKHIEKKHCVLCGKINFANTRIVKFLSQNLSPSGPLTKPTSR